jgi:hypothetical protein
LIKKGVVIIIKTTFYSHFGHLYRVITKIFVIFSAVEEDTKKEEEKTAEEAPEESKEKVAEE